jgi:glucosamine-6-phosphate deaminase
LTIRVFPTAGDAAASLADEVLGIVQAQPNLVVGLPTGRTPVGFYRELVRRIRNSHVEVSRITTFNLDEFLGVGPTQPGSYRTYMERHLFQPIGLSPEQIHFLDGSAADPQQECERYERAMAALGGIDVQILGIGSNGHVGFNEPGEWLTVRTHRVTLRPETRRANAALFGGDPDRVPREALSMGVGTILAARKIVLLATGSEKARAVEKMVRGPLTTAVPASFLQLHGDVDVVLDRAAASRLQES